MTFPLIPNTPENLDTVSKFKLLYYYYYYLFILILFISSILLIFAFTIVG